MSVYDTIRKLKHGESFFVPNGDIEAIRRDCDMANFRYPQYKHDAYESNGGTPGARIPGVRVWARLRNAKNTDDV